jgi:hypothetical protein
MRCKKEAGGLKNKKEVGEIKSVEVTGAVTGDLALAKKKTETTERGTRKQGQQL